VNREICPCFRGSPSCRNACLEKGVFRERRGGDLFCRKRIVYYQNKRLDQDERLEFQKVFTSHERGNIGVKLRNRWKKKGGESGEVK